MSRNSTLSTSVFHQSFLCCMTAGNHTFWENNNLFIVCNRKPVVKIVRIPLNFLWWKTALLLYRFWWWQLPQQNWPWKNLEMSHTEWTNWRRGCLCCWKGNIAATYRQNILTICMKWQTMLWGKIRKIFLNVVCWNFDSASQWDYAFEISVTIISSVAQLDAPSDWRPGGCGFNPCRGRQHSFLEIDHEIFSTVILSLPLIQEGQLSVSGERMVNRLED